MATRSSTTVAAARVTTSAAATRAHLKAIGSRYRSNALAQEKTGEAWVDAHLYGGHTRGEFEHAEVSVSSARTRGCHRASREPDGAQGDRQDPARAMIVIDPVVTETAKLADVTFG